MSVMLKILQWIKEAFRKIFGLHGQKEVKVNETKRLPKNNPIPAAERRGQVKSKAKRKASSKTKPRTRPRSVEVVEPKKPKAQPEEFKVKHKGKITAVAFGKMLWLCSDRDWQTREAAREVGVHCTSFSEMKREPSRVEEALEAWSTYMEVNGIPDYEMRFDSKKHERMLLVGKIIYLSQVKEISISEASREVSGVSLSTVFEWRRNQLSKYTEALELYKATLKKPKAVKAKPAVGSCPSSKEIADLASKAGVNWSDAYHYYEVLGEQVNVLIGAGKVPKPIPVWEVYLDLLREEVKPKIARGMCEMLVIMDKDRTISASKAAVMAGTSNGSFTGLSSKITNQTNRYSSVFAAAKKAMGPPDYAKRRGTRQKPAPVSSKVSKKASKASKKTPKVPKQKQKDSEMDLAEAWEHAIPSLKEDKKARNAKAAAEKARQNKINGLNPSACWDRLTAVCYYQMDGFTLLQACRKAEIDVETYNVYKDADVTHESPEGGVESFRAMALEAEAVRAKKNMLKRGLKKKRR